MGLIFCVFFALYAATGASLRNLNELSVDSELHDSAVLHRTKRSTTTSFRVPQPTQEFPLVLFAGDDYNNVSDGFIHRSLPNEYRVWARTVQNGIQEFVFRSLLVLPGWKLTFQACCAAGNSWTASVSNVSNISSLHLYMFDNVRIGEAIFYTQWLHWIQEFSVKAEQCVDTLSCPNITCQQTCYFGSCGQDGHCQCKDGYSGDNCEKRPTNPVVYPNLTYPLLLFPQKSFVGTPVKVPPDSYHVFARNHENSQTFTHLSARILFTRSITFSRNREDDQKYVVSPGSDISDMESYFGSNPDIGKPLWFNYAATVEAEFYIKVEGSPHCTNCSETGGSCYTGKCVCLPGYNGTHCTTTP